MRLIFVLPLLLAQILAGAQPVFLTEDRNVNKTTDGYQQGFLVDSPKELDGVIYFCTPNFRLYRTDGTAGGTKMLVQFPAGSLVYLKAVTKKFVYFTLRRGSDLELKRMDRTTLRQESLYNHDKPLALEPAYSQTYLAPSKDLLTIRMFSPAIGVTQLIAFADDGPANAKMVAASMKSDNSSLLNTFSDVGFIGPQIFYNGFQKKGGDGSFEYTIQSSVPATKAGGMDYDIKSFYSIRDQGFELNDHFYTVNDSLFSIGFFQNKQTSTRDLFIGSLHPQALRVPATLPTDQNFAWGEVLDNRLYLVNGTRLLSWTPGTDRINEVYRKRTYQYQRLNPDHSLLKCGNFMVYREEDSLFTFDLNTRKFSYVEKPERLIPRNSLYKGVDHYAWATDSAIFYPAYKGMQPHLVRFDPVSRQSSTVTFPEFKGEQFDSFAGFFQAAGKFIILTKYLGKKDQAVYRVFAM